MSLNTVLVSINGTLGNVAFYNNEDIILGKSACYFNLSENIDKYYIKIVIESQYFISYALRNATGSTISNLSLRAMRDFPVPLPPLAEQRRIVAKVDGLMALCDALEAKLRGERAAAERLADAVVRAVVGSEQRTPRQMELAPSAAPSAPTNGIGDLKNGKLVQAPAFNDDK